MLINPFDYVLDGTEACYLIADDEDEAKDLSKYGSSLHVRDLLCHVRCCGCTGTSLLVASTQVHARWPQGI